LKSGHLFLHTPVRVRNDLVPEGLMIPLWKVHAIEALLAEDVLSQRAIAKRLQVGRGVVAGIANGTRPDYKTLRQAAAPGPPPAEQPWQRCPQCGAMVQLPCLACRTRRVMVHGRCCTPAGLPASDEGLRLNLIGLERMRYEEAYARRRILLVSGNRQRLADRRITAT
jgi:hypothetical protein